MTRWTQADVDAHAQRINHEAVAKLASTGKALVPSKYGNKRTNGYASKREAKRAEELKLMEKAGEIHNIREQVEYVLIPKQDGERACKYIADFVYAKADDSGHYKTVVEDAKGYRDPVYRIKRKLMKFVHGISIKEV